MPSTTIEAPSQVQPSVWLARLQEADLSQPRAFLPLAIVYFALRLPFMNVGYGTDTDAWRVVLTGRYLWAHGQYFPSRLPGNPLHDLIISALLPGGWLATGLATAAVSLLGVYVFARMLVHLRLQAPGLMTICFAFAPLLFINSIATVDFMWTLTCLLGCYYCSLRGRTVWAGVLLGCAAGFRMQSPVFGLAIVMLLWRQRRLRELPAFVLAGVGTMALAFAPVLVVYGKSFLNFYDAPIPYKDVIELVGKQAIGVLGVLGVGLGALLSLKRLRQLPNDLLGDAFISSWLVVLACYAFVFLRLPHQVGYLIPVVPFGMLLMARYFTRPALLLAIACILLSGVLDVTTHGANPGLQSLRHAGIAKGLVLENRDTMVAQKSFAKKALGDVVPDHAYVMLGYIFPVAAVLAHKSLTMRIYEHDYNAISMLSDRGEAVDSEHDIHYVWLMPYDAFSALRSQGYNFYVVPDSEGGVYDLYGYRPTLFGASFLRLLQPNSSTTNASKDTGR